MTVLVDFEKQLELHRIPLCCKIDPSVLYEKLPSSSPMRLYIARQTARMWVKYEKHEQGRDVLDDYPKQLVTDVLHTILAVPRDILPAKGLKAAVWCPCNYHEHITEQEKDKCKVQQAADGAFYLSFLRACMSEVYKIDEEKAQEIKAEDVESS